MQTFQAQPAVVSTAQEFLVKVYSWMTAGLALTGVVAYLTFSSGFVYDIARFMTPLFLASLAFVWFLQSRMDRISATAASIGFAVYAGLLGLVLSPIFAVYTDGSIARVFFITAGTFGGMSLYGMTTKSDLSSVGSLCVMGFWGIFLASIVNLFFVNSDQWSWIISFIGVFVFTGLAAYDNQQLMQIAQRVDHTSDEGKKTAIFGALRLYTDFLNLFLSLLRLMGGRRN